MHYYLREECYFRNFATLTRIEKEILSENMPLTMSSELCVLNYQQFLMFYTDSRPIFYYSDSFATLKLVSSIQTVVKQLLHRRSRLPVKGKLLTFVILWQQVKLVISP